MPLTTKQFHDPLLQVLGEAVNYTAGVFVPISNDLIRRVIWASGFDPDRLEDYGDPKEGWCWKGMSNPMGFRRRITLAYLYLHRKAQPHHYTLPDRKRMWGLTQDGVEAARKLGAYQHMPNKGTRNATSRYLDQKIRQTKGDFLNTLRKGISACLPLDGVDRIDDHVQTFITRLISRDGLRTRIESGSPMEDRFFIQWAVNSAKTDIRNEGTDPISREYRGARTYRERCKGFVRKGHLVDDPRVCLTTDENQTFGELDIADSNSPVDLVQDRMQFEALTEKLYQKLATRYPEDQYGERCFKVLQMKMQGFSIKEISEKEGVTRFRASDLLRTARKTIRKIASTPEELQQLLS